LDGKYLLILRIQIFWWCWWCYFWNL